MSSLSYPPLVSAHATPSFLPAIERKAQIYTKQYCEENIYHLSRALLSHYSTESSPLAQVYVVFMSNPHEQLLLFEQRVGDPRRNYCVVWDYHVICVVKPLQGNCNCDKRRATSHFLSKREPPTCDLQSYVYDFDTRLPFPSPLSSYVCHSFVPALQLSAKHTRYFRVVTAQYYLEHFACDRSHMLVKSPLSSHARVHDNKEADDHDEKNAAQYLATPPSYPPIRTKDCVNNLDEFRHFTAEPPNRHGIIMLFEEFQQFFHA